MSKRWNYEEVKEYFSERGFELLDEMYINNSTKLTTKDKYGYKRNIRFSDFLKGKIGRRFHKANPYTIENIKLWLKLNIPEYKLLSTEYLGNGSNKSNRQKQLLKWECDKGHVFYMTLNDIYNGQRCNVCHKFSYTHDDFVEKVIEKYNNEYTVLGKYINSKTKVIMRHNKCGTEWEVNPANFLFGNCCPNNECCHARGEKHYRWNPSLTEEERDNNKSRTTTIEYRQWKISIFKKYNRKCAICGKIHTDNNPLRAHHLDSWDNNIEKRFDEENGVALCEEHHKEFHSIYGYGNNTKEQFEEFIKNIDINKAS